MISPTCRNTLTPMKSCTGIQKSCFSCKKSINRIQNKCSILKTKIQISQTHYILFQESNNQLGACFFNSKRAVLKCNVLDLVIKCSYLSILKGLHCSSSGVINLKP